VRPLSGHIMFKKCYIWSERPWFSLTKGIFATIRINLNGFWGLVRPLSDPY